MRSDFPSRADEFRAQLIVQLADGTLPEHACDAVEAFVARSSVAQARLADQRAVRQILRSGGPAMSAALAAEIEAQAGRRAARRVMIASRWIAASAAVVLLAAVVLASRLIGAAGQPTILQVARLVSANATGAPPSVDRARPGMLRERFAGVTFWDYSRSFGARPAGQRTDRRGGRTERTVYYVLSRGTRMSYTVVSGPPLGLPGAATRTVRVAGVSLRAYQKGRLRYVTLVRAGRTCVVAGEVSTRTLLALAAAPLHARA